MGKNEQFTTEDCIKWKADKNINPITGYKIRKGKGVYNILEKTCFAIKTPPPREEPKKNSAIVRKIGAKTYTFNKDICLKWYANKYTNPFSGYKINEASIIYKTFDDVCKTLNIQQEQPKEKIKEKAKKQSKEKTKNPRHILKRLPTDEECAEWKKNKSKNPLNTSKNNLTIDGPIYKQLEEVCSHIKSPKKAEIKKPIKPKKIIESSSSSSSSSSVSSENKKSSKEHKKTPKKEKEERRTDLYYPDLNDPKFNEKILKLKEIRVHKINSYPDINTVQDFENKAADLCKGFDKSSFQYLIAHYLSYRTPYKSMLVYYSVGVGKTCTAITISEGLLINHSSFDEPLVWVILPGAIEAGFKRQIFDTMKTMDYKTIANQCTGDTYIKMAQLSKDLNQKEVEKRIKKIIKSRYYFFTYEGFANYIENNYTKKGKIVNDKVIIVDEAHNIRSVGNDEDENKRVYTTLMNVAKTGNNNKMILLTATPMYNEPVDIYNLFLLLLTNDKREYLYDATKIFDNSNNLNQKAVKFISLMASNYISFLRGKNPFNFAFKLSPKLSGFKLLDKVIPNTENGNPIDENDKNWIDNVEDGIITSKLGQKQLDFLKSKKVGLMDNSEEDGVKSNFAALQPMNIVFDDSTGKAGFNNFFIKVNEKDQIIVRYNQKYKNLLQPDEQHLGLVAGKFLKIADIIKKSQGIILIYSRFIWSGVMPLAVILEHMGFSRLGTDNILAENAVTHPIAYNGIKTPKYCILSSADPEIMGNTTIDGLMTVINNPANQNGELVKVVLMTPVAGEGLNFLNIREIHLVESWYHFNRVDQIIGRGIRNCSHKSLPLEERNVTVFMHCAINDYNRETADVHAYRISSRKLYQSYIVDELIRNNAIDCSLFKSINYFPKEMFKLGPIDITTSQGVTVKYELGDKDKFKPVCSVDLDKIKEDSLGFREETYKHLGLNIQIKIRNLILELVHNKQRFLSYNSLKTTFADVDEKILMYAIKISVYPNIIIDNLLLVPHQDGIHIIDVIEDKPLKIMISKEMKEEVKEIEINKDFYEKIDKIQANNYDEAIVSLYQSLDENTFKLIIQKLFTTASLNKIDAFLETCFLREGILINKNEFPNFPTDYKYVGFVNIYNEEFEPLIYNQDGNHKNFNPKQLELLKSNRRLIIKPEDLSNEVLPFGLMIPIFENKEKKNKINVFKLLTPGINYGKKSGIVCTSLQKKEHSKFFSKLDLSEEGKNTKESYCFKIAAKLNKINRLSLLPDYKPIKI